jgi:hypothetical protein
LRTFSLRDHSSHGKSPLSYSHTQVRTTLTQPTQRHRQLHPSPPRRASSWHHASHLRLIRRQRRPRSRPLSPCPGPRLHRRRPHGHVPPDGDQAASRRRLRCHFPRRRLARRRHISARTCHATSTYVPPPSPASPSIPLTHVLRPAPKQSTARPSTTQTSGPATQPYSTKSPRKCPTRPQTSSSAASAAAAC